ncbi:hypothetical protein ADU80_13280 [Clostridium botulinum]|uniref:Trypsin-like peptidase domain-containing protein n=1 Tax=Clostridium botulinum TaxID=1491 RepID=A0A9Q1UX62_CLOBO|nr:hypothetical protein [Clostridium botulinum]MCD3228314.1 hypothetical protein [Clostridium botulinum C/D]AEB76395.1 hypothetical protein CbC4_1719 [Clostridium botulinum BKT015925]KEI01250.1 hypothetical protein Z953_09065 [Clostridium botulinum D str. 16868]KEI04862.1 hypothetical protein Y848_12025 [Clostridium botulinum C/D str. Sp77]KLU75939.1 hypothetical protein CBC3_06375 [Clostridium botulinum V891]
MINGFYTCEKCITVFVTKKLSCNELLSNEIIPRCYKGFQTDVKECGMPICDALKTRVRPVINGYSIGNILENNYGTAGCLVADKYLYILSNNHVFALNNRAPIESVIVQPGVNDGGKIEKDVIGHLNRYIPIKFIEGKTKPENIVDCALCKVISRSFVSPKIAFVGIPKGTAKAKLNEDVKKVGRTSELTTGKIKNLSATFTVACSQVGKLALFKNLIVTTRMGQPGDSGSLILNEDNHAIGLYVGSINDITIANPIEKVLDSLKVKLVTA